MGIKASAFTLFYNFVLLCFEYLHIVLYSVYIGLGLELLLLLSFITPHRQHIQGAAKQSNPLRFFAVFFGSRLEFQSKILPTYLVILYTHKSLVSI